MSAISLEPKVRTEEAPSQPGAVVGLQPQANVASSDLARLSLHPNDAPITSQAIRDAAVRRFVTSQGLDCRGDIYEMMEQEADKMVGWGLFPSRDAAETAIWDAYEEFVQQAASPEVSAAIDQLRSPKKIHETTETRLHENLLNYERVLPEFEAANEALTPLRITWLQCHGKLKPFGLDGSIPGWEKRAENLLKQTRDPHKRRCLRPLLQKELDARQAYYTASQRRDALSKLADTRNCDPAYVRDLVIEESHTFAEFLQNCLNPGNRKLNAFVQLRLASLQTTYREAKKRLDDFAKEDAAASASGLTEGSENRETLICMQIKIMDEVMEVLGLQPLDRPDISKLEAQGRSLERFVDLGNPQFVEARIQYVMAELGVLKQAFDRNADIFQKALKDYEAALIQMRQRLVQLQDKLPNFEHMAPLLIGEEDLNYEGPYKEDVAAFVALGKVKKQRAEEIAKLEKQEAELEDQIRQKRVFLGLERSDLLDAVTSAEKITTGFLALQGKEKIRMDHFLWMAMGRPDPTTFEPNVMIYSATEAQLGKMVVLSLAARKLEKLHTSLMPIRRFCHKCNDAKRKSILKKFWNDMLLGNELEREAGEIAQRTLQNAVWIVRGLVSSQGEALSRDEVSYGDTIGEFDAPLFTALNRLSKHNLMLFKDQNARDAIAVFAQALTSKLQTAGALTVDDMTNGFTTLKAASADANKLLASAIAWGTSEKEEGVYAVQLESEDEEPLGIDRTSPEFLEYCHEIILELSSFDAEQ